MSASQKIFEILPTTQNINKLNIVQFDGDNSDIVFQIYITGEEDLKVKTFNIQNELLEPLDEFISSVLSKYNLNISNFSFQTAVNQKQPDKEIYFFYFNFKE